ncbi:hypothetical protein A9P82_07335 [Arachidicoccus ginsenosidimutans]|uniref:RDD family protein n=1 Tax=Arachidicoccus sp. BS20 TaxID=1850526 RepID=UPI0007F13603|nr:RDD family protein [Arachidicoccus sp. BS20]ANI89118.1 hypothetical protein A9P82_07335 [Arachidicoccus sp. BS20]
MQTVGTGTRVLNFLIDTILIFIISIIFSQWYNFHVIYWHYTPLAPYSFFFITLVMYYFLFESIFKRTPGKWLTISKVVSKKKEKPNILQILIRSLARLILIDCFFIPFLNGRTLHDYLSGTYIVEA